MKKLVLILLFILISTRILQQLYFRTNIEISRSEALVSELSKNTGDFLGSSDVSKIQVQGFFWL